MKQSLSLFFLFFLLGITGCSRHEPEAYAPRLVNVALSRERVGVNQPVTVTCGVFSSGYAIQSVEYTWIFSDREAEKAEKTDIGHDRFSKTICFSEAGMYSVAFSAKCIFDRADINGNLSKTVVSKNTFRVVKCDVRTSFWEDDVAETLLNCPDLKYIESEGAYSGTFRDELFAVSNRELTMHVFYYFQSGKLNRVEEISENIFGDVFVEEYFKNYILLRDRLSEIYEYPIEDKLVWSLGYMEKVEFGIRDETYANKICEALLGGKAKLVMVFKAGKTQVTIEIFKNKNDKITCLRTYNPIN